MHTIKLAMISCLCWGLISSCGFFGKSKKHSKNAETANTNPSQGDGLSKAPRLRLNVSQKSIERGSLLLQRQSKKFDSTPNGQFDSNINVEEIRSLSLDERQDKIIKVKDNVTISFAHFSIAAIKVKKNIEKTTEEEEEEDGEEDEESGILGQILGIITSAQDGELEEIFASIKNLEKSFLDKIANNDPSTKYKGPFLYDVVQQTVSPSFPEVTLEENSFKRIDFMFSRYFSDEGRSDLDRKVYRIEGVYTIDDEEYPFIIEDSHSLRFSLSSSEDLVADPLTLNQLVIEFDVARWFQNLDFNSASPSRDGVITISPRRNRRLLETFNRNLQDSVRFALDKNGDGNIDPEEPQSPPSGGGEDGGDDEKEDGDDSNGDDSDGDEEDSAED